MKYFFSNGARPWLRFILAALLTAALFGTANGQGSAFTYQGRLNDGANPANGNYDLTFALFDATSAGNQVGSVLTNTTTSVTNGLFTVTLDFGAGVLTGADRWLEIGVATNGGTFSALAPRQQLTSAPYALRAANAGIADTASVVNASNIFGTLSTTQLPSSVVTNGATGLTLAGSFSGDGSGLNNLNAGNLGTGTVDDTRLSTNVALLNANQTFSGSNIFTGVSLLTNVNNTLTGVHSGNAAGLTSLNASNLSTGTLPDARLSTNVALLNANQTFSGSNVFKGVALLTNANNVLTGTHAGNGAALTSLNATNLSSGTLPDARLSTNVALLNANQIFSGSNSFNGVALLTNANNILTGTHAGNGAGLTSLNATNLSGGTLPDARLSTNVALLSANQIFSGAVQFNSSVSSSGFSGNGAGLTNLDLGQNSAGAIHPLSFTPITASIADSTFAVTAADVNGDGKPDLIAAGYNTSSLYVLTNNGNGGFVLSTNYLLSGPQPRAVVAGDINGDSKPDVIVANANGSLSVLTNNGSGGFALSATLFASTIANSVVLADVNGDGKLDLINDSGGTIFQVFTNNGSGGFVLSVNISDPGVFRVAVADVNGDGKVDVVSANGTAGVFVFTNNGNGGFALSSMLPPVPGPGPQSLVLADVNGDGKADIVAASVSTNKLWVYTNNGSGGFALAGSPVAGGNPQALAAADIDGDGRLDLVTANSGANTDSILINSGGGNFALRATLSVGTSPQSVAIADFNGDGRPDLLTGCASASTLFVHLNTGVEFDGTFVGSGGSLSNLNASQLLSGTIADARLSTNVALLNANQTFSGSNTFKGVALLTNANNTVTGNGAGLTTLNAGNLSSGTIADARLSTNVALLSINNQFSGNVGIGIAPTSKLQVVGNRTNGIANSVVLVQNTNTTANASPALRVQNDGGNTPFGALSVSANVSSTAPNSAIAMFGNVSAWVVTITNDGTIYSKGVALTSDRNAKERFTAVDSILILEKVAALPISEWDYKDTPGVRHLGPVAQDFHSAFGLNGADETHISVVDEGGVALAAIQGLNQMLEETRAENHSLKGRLENLERLLNLRAEGGAR